MRGDGEGEGLAPWHNHATLSVPSASLKRGRSVPAHREVTTVCCEELVVVVPLCSLSLRHTNPPSLKPRYLLCLGVVTTGVAAGVVAAPRGVTGLRRGGGEGCW